MNKNPHILLLEDVPTDAKLIEHTLLKGAFSFVLKRVTTEEAFRKALKEFKPDIILADYKLPKFDGISALQIVKKNHPDIPSIFVSGNIGEDLAIATLRKGAKDYILKDNLSRLVPSVRRALHEYEEHIKHKKIETQLKHMAFHDALTCLPNRTLFYDRLNLVLAHARRTNETLAVLFLDLDRFKRVNDTFGHATGDLLLCDIAERLKNCVRDEDTVARFAGDEFTLLLLGITKADHVISIATKLLDALKQPLMFNEHKLYITASIGIAVYPDDGRDAETLLKNADAAMYHAKEQGKNNFQFYTPAMHAESFEKMVLESNLRSALDREEFVVYYQPLLNIGTGEVSGMEALVRWQHPDRGLIYPEEFLALSENTRLIVFIDELVLYIVCAQIKAWLDAGFRLQCVAVNLSVHTFQQPKLVEIITSVLQKTGLDPHFLGLEITEGIAMENIDTAIPKLINLRGLGIQIAIDDFGTGFSSLRYLAEFPTNKLKISQYFVNGIATNPHDRAIISSIITLAQDMKLKVVAEGVETKEQLIFLKQQQCDEMQGYFFSKPLPAEECGKMLVKCK